MIHRYVIRDKKVKISEETLYSVLKRFIVTEKTTLCREKNEYTFEVPLWASKIFVKQAIESLFGVKVNSVNTLVLKGKRKRFKGVMGVKSDAKKAIVSLAKGQLLDMESGGNI